MKNTFPCRRVGAKTSDFVSLGLGRCEMPAFFFLEVLNENRNEKVGL